MLGILQTRACTIPCMQFHVLYTGLFSVYSCMYIVCIFYVSRPQVNAPILCLCVSEIRSVVGRLYAA